MLGAGNHTIEADYSGDSNYALLDGQYTQVVGQAPLSIVPNDLSRPVGQPNPPLTYEFTGFVNGDTAASADITGSADLTTTATINSAIGNYPITVTGAGTLTSPNYDFPSTDFKSGTLTITLGASDAVVGSTSQGSTYGQPVSFMVNVRGDGTTPQGTVQFVVNGNNFGTPVPLANGSATSLSTSSLDPGTYIIQAEYSGDSNDAATIGTFTQVVNKASLTLIADDESMVHDGYVPMFTYNYTGFVNGDNSASAGINASIGLNSTASSASPAGYYSIQPTVNSFSSPNYVVGSMQDGILTIAPTVVKVLVNIGRTSEPLSGLTRKQQSAKITALDVIFSDNVNVSSSMLQLQGVKASTSSVSRFTYSTATIEATWRLRRPIAADRLAFNLSGEAAPPVSGTGPPISASPFTQSLAGALAKPLVPTGRRVKFRPGDAVASIAAIRETTQDSAGTYLIGLTLDGSEAIPLSAQLRRRAGRRP